MSRQVRRVPADWQHPTEACLVVIDGKRRWRPVWQPLTEDEMDEMLTNRERTHWQMYETTSEGTPISPVMESPEALAVWLVDNGATAFANMTGTYDQWLSMITGSGNTVSAVIDRDGLSPGWLDKAAPRYDILKKGKEGSA